MDILLIVFGTILAAIVLVVGVVTCIVGFKQSRSNLKLGGIAMTLVCAPLFIYGGISSNNKLQSIYAPRAFANPPIDMNNPEGLILLQEYLNREQYGNSPLLFDSSAAAPDWYYQEFDTVQQKN